MTDNDAQTTVDPMIEPIDAPLTRAELYAMAVDIADHACRSDIEIYCHGERAGTYTWYDTDAVMPNDPELHDAVKQAVRYLSARGLIHRSAVTPQRVCFRPDRWAVDA